MASLVPPFTDSHASLLQSFLSAPERPKGTLTYPQLAGFLFSLANGPESIPPSEWMPMVFDDQEAEYGTVREAEQVVQAMMALHNHCAQERIAAGGPRCDMRDQPLDNLREDAPLSRWAQGFSLGHDYLENVWNESIPEELDKDLGASLMVLTFFASPKLAHAYHEEGEGKRSFAQLAEAVVAIFPGAMREYAHLGRAIYQARREAGSLGSGPSGRRKIGRNDPCPCRSGKKFKKCCGKSA